MLVDEHVDVSAKKNISFYLLRISTSALMLVFTCGVLVQ